MAWGSMDRGHDPSRRVLHWTRTKTLLFARSINTLLASLHLQARVGSLAECRLTRRRDDLRFAVFQYLLTKSIESSSGFGLWRRLWRGDQLWFGLRRLRLRLELRKREHCASYVGSDKSRIVLGYVELRMLGWRLDHFLVRWLVLGVIRLHCSLLRW